MLKKLFNTLFGGTVDSVIADITAKVAKLRALSERHAQEARDLQAAGDALYKKSDAAVAQSVRAYNIAEKFDSLIA